MEKIEMDIESEFGMPYQFTKYLKPLEKGTISLDDFTLLCVLGKGAFAKVILVRKKDTKQIYALKVIKKSMIQNKKQEEKLKTERAILVTLD